MPFDDRRCEVFLGNCELIALPEGADLVACGLKEIELDVVARYLGIERILHHFVCGAPTTEFHRLEVGMLQCNKLCCR